MGRKLFNLAAAVSLVCCVLAVGMWVRSCSTRDIVTAYPSTTSYLDSESGEFAIGLETSTFRSFRVSDCKHSRAPVGYISPSLKLSSFLWIESGGNLKDISAFLHTYHGESPHFAFRTSKRDPNSSVIAMRLGYWVIVVGTAFLPTIWLVRRRRHPACTCTNCGYDLRATPERCPECGKEVAVKCAP